jgi:hypothetical protein
VGDNNLESILLKAQHAQLWVTKHITAFKANISRAEDAPYFTLHQTCVQADAIARKVFAGRKGQKQFLCQSRNKRCGSERSHEPSNPLQREATSEPIKQ